MPILFQSTNFRVEPFADRSGVFFIIIRKSNNKVVAKIPTEKKADVKRRIAELEEAQKITQERIRKVQSAARTGVGIGKEFIKEFNKIAGSKPRKKKKKKKSKKRRKN